MTDENPKRPYRMRRRAEAQEDTRRRIAASAVALHGTVGPARTSISAVAEHAGVRRSTVYRHFPDEAALFDACTAHWAAANPAPDLAAWAAIDPPNARLAVALPELYAFYGRTEPMLTNLLRDEQAVPLVAHHFAGFRAYLATAGETLMAGRDLPAAARRRTRAALGHAVAFSTWKSLVREQQLSERDALALMRALVAVNSRTTGSGSSRSAPGAR